MSLSHLKKSHAEDIRKYRRQAQLLEVKPERRKRAEATLEKNPEVAATVAKSLQPTLTGTNITDLTDVLVDWGKTGAGHRGDKNGDGRVDVDDIWEVTKDWNPAPIPTPTRGAPPESLLTKENPIKMSRDGALILSDRLIDARGSSTGMAIEVPNDISMAIISLVRTHLLSSNYGAYCANTDHLSVKQSTIESGPGGNDYTIRGLFNTVEIIDSILRCAGTKAHRFVKANSFICRNTEISGGRLMCGGGYENEWENEQVFNGTFDHCPIKVASIQVYYKSVATFDGCDLTGTGEIFVDGDSTGGGQLTIKNCTGIKKITVQGKGKVTAPGWESKIVHR